MTRYQAHPYSAHRRGRRALYWLRLVGGAACFVFVGWCFLVLAFLMTP
jgi:hypothetical protein